MSEKIGKRSISFDLMRVIAAFSVVVLHASGMYIGKFPLGSMNFRIANFYDSIARYGVPIFVMISGAIFLSEEKPVTTKKLWSRNILRLFIIYWVWSFAYYTYQCVCLWHISIFHKGIVGVVTGCVYASDHFWFIFMILGLYALVPFLRTWLAHATKKELDYFVVLFVGFQIVGFTIPALVNKTLVTELFDMVSITELTGYLGYFVLGHILTKYGISKKWKTLVYVLVPVGVLVNFVVSDVMSLQQGAYTPGIYDSFGLFTFIQIVAIFVFFTELGAKRKVAPAMVRALEEVSKDTLGIYLMHVGVLNVFMEEGLFFESMAPLIGVPVISLMTFVLCGLVSAVLRRIPVVGKYLA